jgi:type IV secretion system protein VirB8
MAQVRFMRHELNSEDDTPADSEWLATVVYRYLNPPVDERSRLINPVGFQVTQFRIDPVVVPTAPVAGMTARGAK